jgi:hypothetical protein
VRVKKSSNLGPLVGEVYLTEAEVKAWETDPEFRRLWSMRFTVSPYDTVILHREGTEDVVDVWSFGKDPGGFTSN